MTARVFYEPDLANVLGYPFVLMYPQSPNAVFDPNENKQRIAAQPPGWALSPAGLNSLRGVGTESGGREAVRNENAATAQPSGANGSDVIGGGEAVDLSAEDPLATPVMIVEAAETAARASSFVGQNTGRLAATPLQLHKSGLVAEDPDAVTVANVCDRAGIKILATSPKKFNPGETMAIGTISSLVDRRGAMKARIILEILAKAGFAPSRCRRSRRSRSF